MASVKGIRVRSQLRVQRMMVELMDRKVLGSEKLVGDSERLHRTPWSAAKDIKAEMRMIRSGNTLVYDFTLTARREPKGQIRIRSEVQSS